MPSIVGHWRLKLCTTKVHSFIFFTSVFFTAEFHRVTAEFLGVFKLGHLRWQRVLRGRIEQQLVRKKLNFSSAQTLATAGGKLLKTKKNSEKLCGYSVKLCG
jgi:hypothetical protein